MPTFKLIVSDPRTGTSTAHELKEQRAQMFIGVKIGDTVDASTVGIPGQIHITGGSDRAGFPMRPDVTGGKRRVLLAKGPGYRPRRRGERRRKLVRGNTITDDIYQINAVLHEEEKPVTVAEKPSAEVPKPPEAPAPPPVEKKKVEAEAAPKAKPKPKGKKSAQAPPTA